MKSIITIILCIMSVLSVLSMIYDVESCAIHEVSNNDTSVTVTVVHDNNLYSAKYGLNMLQHFINEADKNVIVIFHNDEIVAII